MKKRITILGSTGSIGCQTLEVVDMFPDQFEVLGLAAGSNLEKLAGQVRKYKPRKVSLGRAEDIPAFRKMITPGLEITSGVEGMAEVAVQEDVDIVVTSITGTLGLLPTVAAIRAGKDIALANKETLVAAGELVMSLVKEKGVRVLPVDSEHSAIFQCLRGENRSEIRKLVLTASGGPFKNKTAEQLATVAVEDALNHPNWSMGRKITVDSATMMNKGLEVIEARWLFNVEFADIEVVIHPQSIIHSMVEFNDGSVIAQLGLPDMRVPIQFALSFPDRWANDLPKLDLFKASQLTFERPRPELFNSLKLAFEAGKQGGTMPAVMNAANEIAVALFLERKINFLNIPQLVEKVMANHKCILGPALPDILAADSWAREEAQRLARTV